MAKGVVKCTNIEDGKMSKIVHHCLICKASFSNKCIKNMHLAYCPVVDENGDRCGYLFSVQSPGGCHNHPYGEGYNKGIQNLRRGLPEDHKTAWELQKEAEAEAEEAAKAQAIEEELAARPYNTDWKKSEYKEKKPPREKTKDKKGKKNAVSRY